MEILEFQAPAKINLGLQILYKRNDGYHEINTVFRKINLFDKLVIKPSNRLCIHTIPDIGISARENLVYVALNRLLGVVPEGYYKGEIELYKNIPLSAGLGGGSSDCATALIALNKFWGLNVPEVKLEGIAKEIGSDVAFFMKDERTACARGRGEILDYFELDLPYHILLIYPGIKISTAWAYGAYAELNRTATPVDFKALLLENYNKPSVLREKLFNDFENIIFPHYPVLAEIKSKLYNYGSVFALLSGSGSSIFGLFETRKKLEKARAEFKNLQTFEV